jgi:C-terminal processing protease CtpA/Prc
MSGPLGISLTATDAGLLIKSVNEDSPFFGNVKVGDVIECVNGISAQDDGGSDATAKLKTSEFLELKLAPPNVAAAAAVTEEFGSPKKLEKNSQNKAATAIQSAQRGRTARREVSATRTRKAELKTSAESAQAAAAAGAAAGGGGGRRKSVVDLSSGLVTLNRSGVAMSGPRGISLTATDVGLLIKSVNEDSPLFGNVKVGDVIECVNGISAQDDGVSDATVQLKTSAFLELKLAPPNVAAAAAVAEEYGSPKTPSVLKHEQGKAATSIQAAQ